MPLDVITIEFRALLICGHASRSKKIVLEGGERATEQTRA